jgi:hypothetical protein
VRHFVDPLEVTMSTPMTPDQTLAAYKAEGLTVKEFPGWRTRCRCCPDGVAHRPHGPFVRGWGDVNGQLAHITAGGLGGRSVETYIKNIINGDPATPCKSQTVIAPDGAVWLNSTGRCNHAGKVGGTVRDHMRKADFSLADDFDNRFTGGSVDGNSFSYGDEVIAASAMNPAQYASLVKVHAARARFHGWTGQESVGHGEVSNQRGKGDPNLHMGKFRTDVMARVKVGTTTTPPKPDPPVVPPPPKPSPVTLNGLHWNVAGSDTVNGYQAENATRGPAVGAYAKAIGFDVFTACEAGQHNLRAGISKGLGITSWCEHSKAIWVTSKIKLLTGRKSYADTVYSYLKSVKYGAGVFGTKDGKKFAVLEIHTDYRKPAKQAKQVQSLFKKFIKDADRLGVPRQNIVVCGDFNPDLGGSADNPFKALTDWDFVEHGDTNDATFLDGRHLDGVLAHKNAKITVTRPDRANKGVRLSDHYPRGFAIELV